MDTILHYVNAAGVAMAPVLAAVLMALVSALFYQLTGLLPGFMRGYIEREYRDREAQFRDNLTEALIHGWNSATRRGLPEEDALTAAVRHAIQSNPESYAHFVRTSNMRPETLKEMARGLAAERPSPKPASS